MSTSRALTIAAIAGTILLIPVLVILALGLYGSSITGDFPLAEDHGPELQIEPSSGVVGSDITIRGVDWVPRTLIRVEMIVASVRPELTADGRIDTRQTPSPAVYVGQVIASRAGTFTVETQLPTTLPLTAQSTISFRAQATYRAGEFAGASESNFDVIAGPGVIEATIVDAGSGQPLTEGFVDLLGLRGDVLAILPIASDGRANFAGLAPGPGYDVRARVPGYQVLRTRGITVTESEPSSVRFEMPPGLAGRIVAGGVPLVDAAEPPTMAVIDLPSLTPLPPAATTALPPAWAMASDPASGRAFALDEVATHVEVIDAESGSLGPPIPLTFTLEVRVVDTEEKPVAEASVRLFWNVRGSRVFVKSDRTDAEGRIRVPNLISGSRYELLVTAESHFQPLGERVVVQIKPNVISTATVVLRPEPRAEQSLWSGEPSRANVEPGSAGSIGSQFRLAPLAGASRAPATALVTADIAVEPANGRVYVTGSDLDRGHVFVLDPDSRQVIHDWEVPAGVGDIVPVGDGKTVYLANRPFSTVARFNVETGEEEARATVPSWPEALARDASGRLFVASLRDGSVSRLDPTTLEATTTRRLEEGVNRLAVDERSSTLIATNLWSDTVTGLDAETLDTRFLLPVAKSPRAVALDPATGFLIVGSADQGTVAVYSPETFELAQSLQLRIPINDIVTVSAADA
jgi:outer membrane protein assembly factor BamB